MGPATPTPPAEITTEMNPEEEAKLEDRYKQMVWDLVENHGFSPRKARRYLESQARRATKKIIRQGRVRQEQLRREGKIVDTSDITAQLDQELAEELAKDAGEMTENVEVEETYKAPTSEF